MENEFAMQMAQMEQFKSAMSWVALCCLIISIPPGATIFKKVGLNPFLYLVPFYNTYLIATKIFRKPQPLLFWLGFVPILNIYIILRFNWEYVKAFNCGFGVFLLKIFLPPIALIIMGDFRTWHGQENVEELA